MFLGDDVLKHANRTNNNYGTTALFDLTWTGSYSSNGAGTVTLSVAMATGEVMDGEFGTVDEFEYYADVDEGTAAGLGEMVLMEHSGGQPAVLAAGDGGQRTVTAMVSTYNSHDCPISDTDGLYQIETLFKNAVWWAGGW